MITSLLLSTCTSLGQTQINGGQIRNGAITDAKVASNAAIAFTKINFTGATPVLVGAQPPLTFVAPLSKTDNTVSFLVADVPHGGTGLTSLDSGLIPFGTGGTIQGTNINFNWDNTTETLTIHHLRVEGIRPPPPVFWVPPKRGDVLVMDDSLGTVTYTDPSNLINVQNINFGGGFVATPIPTPELLGIPVFLPSYITTIQVTDGANFIDGELFILDDLISIFTFEFDTNNAVTEGNIPVVIAQNESAEEIKDILISIINSTTIRATATTGSSPSELLVTMNEVGAGGGTNSETVIEGEFSVSDWQTADLGESVTYRYSIACYETLPYITDRSAVVSMTAPTGINIANPIQISWDSKGATHCNLYRAIGDDPTKLIYVWPGPMEAPYSYRDTDSSSGTEEELPTINNTGKVVAAKMKVTGLTLYADNAAALAAGLTPGDFYLKDYAGEYAILIVH